MKLVNPVNSTNIISGFGTRRGVQHKGVDIAVPSGTRVVSPARGIIVASVDDARDGGKCGGFIKIKHQVEGETFFTKYCHLKKRYARVGDTVNAGESIGLSGGGKDDPHKGNSEGPHLHFELLDSGENHIDPQPYILGASLVGTGALLSKSKSSDKSGDKSTTDPNDENRLLTGLFKNLTPALTAAGLAGMAFGSGVSENHNIYRKKNMDNIIRKTLREFVEQADKKEVKKKETLVPGCKGAKMGLGALVIILEKLLEGRGEGERAAKEIRMFLMGQNKVNSEQIAQILKKYKRDDLIGYTGCI